MLPLIIPQSRAGALDGRGRGVGQPRFGRVGGAGGGGVAALFRLGVVAQGEALHLEVLRHGEEGVELLLCHVHLAVVHEVEDGDQVGVLDALEVEQRVLVAVPPQDRPEEG